MARGTLEFINIVPYAVLFTAITYVATKNTKVASTVGAMGVVVPNVINFLELKF
jgi:hypothetical protein